MFTWSLNIFCLCFYFLLAKLFETEACLVGRFGQNCTEMCVCPHNVVCDPKTGQCKGTHQNCTTISEGPTVAIIGISTLCVILFISTTTLFIILCRRRTLHVRMPTTEDLDVHYHEIQPYGEFPREELPPEITPSHRQNENVHNRLLLPTNNLQRRTSGPRNIVDGGYLNPYCVVQPCNTDRVYKRLFPPLTRSLSTGYLTPLSSNT